MNAATEGLAHDRLEHFAMLGLHTASLLHEINNRLATVGITLETFSKEVRDPVCMERCHHLFQAHRDIERMIREVSALAAGRTGSFFKTESVRVEELVEDLRSIAPLLSVVGEAGLLVACDRGKAVRALGDLVRNAIQSGASHLRLDVRRVFGQVHLRVADDGPGIPAELRNRLFEPGATVRKAEGNGLGLFSSKWILEGMGGSLRLEASTNHGTSFLAALPLAVREA